MNLLTIIPFLIILLVTTTAYAVEKADEERLDKVAQRSMLVIPFDLEKTTNIFSKTPMGGLQLVVVKDKSDAGQIRLIRAYLSEISDDFKRGDFSKPERVHGADMPGLAELKSARPGQIKIEYKEVPDGAQITYSVRSPELINVFHQWFDAQISDHARHAVPR
jgi:hypothetical protein